MFLKRSVCMTHLTSRQKHLDITLMLLYMVLKLYLPLVFLFSMVIDIDENRQWHFMLIIMFIRTPSMSTPRLMTKEIKSLNSFNARPCLTRDKLSNVMPYFVYRILSHAGHFQPRSFIFPKGSVRMLYSSFRCFNAIPMDLFLGSYGLPHTVRRLLKYCFDYIIDDFLHSRTKGIVSTDPA